MTDLNKPTEQADPKATPQDSNPSSIPEPVEQRSRRIPMSTARRRLEVPIIPGYNLHWFLEKNVEQAQQGWYEFVSRDEVHLNQHSPGTSFLVSGNQDLGTNVSIVTQAGDGPTRLYLMKIKLEYFNEDQEALQNMNLDRLKAIFVDQQVFAPGASPDALQMRPRDAVTYGTSSFNKMKPLLQRKYVAKSNS